MFTVQDIYADAQKIVGTCDDETLFRRITEAIELLANGGQWDPQTGVVDICTTGAIGAHGNIIALPREVVTPLAVNISGVPSMGRDRLFSFHLNGPGDECRDRCSWTWQDQGDSPIFRDLVQPCKLYATVDLVEDENSEMWVYGFDPAGNYIRTKEDGEYVDGWRVPTTFTYTGIDPDAPTFARVTRVRKARTYGPVRLSSLDATTYLGTLIGIFQYNELEPLFRRIKINAHACWVRIAYRKAVFKVESKTDLIPLNVSRALLTMMRAIKAYDDDDPAVGATHEANARRWLSEEQWTRTPPVSHPIQVDPHNMLHDKSDDIDSSGYWR